MTFQSTLTQMHLRFRSEVADDSFAPRKSMENNQVTVTQIKGPKGLAGYTKLAYQLPHLTCVFAK